MEWERERESKCIRRKNKQIIETNNRLQIATYRMQQFMDVNMTTEAKNNTKMIIFFFLEIRFSLNTSSCVMINSLNAMDGLLYFWSIHIQNVCKRYEYAMKKNKFYVIYDMLSVKME